MKFPNASVEFREEISVASEGGVTDSVVPGSAVPASVLGSTVLGSLDTVVRDPAVVGGAAAADARHMQTMMRHHLMLVRFCS